MGTVYRKTATKPLPSGAKLIVRKGKRLTEWADAKGKRRTAPVTTGNNGADRLVVAARTFTAKYRNGKGHVVEGATGCRDETAARAVLADLEKRADKVRSGLRTVGEDAVVDHQGAALAGHVRDFLEHQKAKAITPLQIHNTRRRLERVSDGCGFRRLANLNAAALEGWLVARQAEDMGAVMRNRFREAWVTFGNWCVRNDRLLALIVRLRTAVGASNSHPASVLRKVPIKAATNELDERITASPAISGKELIYRTDSHLLCLGLPRGQ